MLAAKPAAPHPFKLASLVLLSWVWFPLAQFMLVPAGLPASWQPDLALIWGLIALSCLPAEYALLLLFGFGVEMDLLGSERLGLMTLSYTATGYALALVQREIQELGGWGAYLAVVGGTALAYALALGLQWLLAIGPPPDEVGAFWLARLKAAALFGLGAAFGLREALRRLGCWSVEANEASRHGGAPQPRGRAFR